jgi:hypothetical protein
MKLNIDQIEIKTLKVGVIINVIMAVCGWVFYSLTNSEALLLDGNFSFITAVSTFLAIFIVKEKHKKTVLFPYGNYFIMNLIFKITILVVLIFSPSHVMAQETNYWYQNFGAVSSLKGGIEAAGIDNPAAIYYNPGALAFMDGDYFDGQADVISLNALNIDNAGGKDVDLKLFQVDIAPSIFVFSRRLESNEKITFSVGVLTRVNQNYSFGLQHEQVGHYMLPNEDEEIFQGDYKYENRIKEGWIMGAISYRINENIGLGMSTNIFIRTQDYFKSYNARAFYKNEYQNNLPLSKLTSNSEEQKLNYRVMGFIFKPGINFDLEPVKLGLTLTTPSLSLGLLNNKSNRSQTSHLPDEAQKYYNESNAHSFYSGMYKTPLSINLGAEYQFKKVSIGFSSEWFAKINKYNLIKENSDSTNMMFPSGSNANYAIPVMANKSIINFGVSVVYDIKESLSYIGSVRTDFSYADTENLNTNTDFVPYISDWDLYHVTSGFEFILKKASITFGADYAYGHSNNKQQFVNMTNASQSNSLRGTIDNSASANFHNLSLSIGLNIELTKGNKNKPNSYR